MLCDKDTLPCAFHGPWGTWTFSSGNSIRGQGVVTIYAAGFTKRDETCRRFAEKEQPLRGPLVFYLVESLLGKQLPVPQDYHNLDEIFKDKDKKEFTDDAKVRKNWALMMACYKDTHKEPLSEL